MKGFVVMMTVAGLAVWGLAVEAMESKGKPEVKTTLKGEIVDMGCFMGHGARGEKHKECALKCVANGMPMGLLAADGRLYVITLDHDNADPYNHCKEWVGSMVEITGAVSQRAGARSIDCAEAKAAQ